MFVVPRPCPKIASHVFFILFLLFSNSRQKTAPKHFRACAAAFAIVWYGKKFILVQVICGVKLLRSWRVRVVPESITIADLFDMEGRKCLINNALNTFYLRLYGVSFMVKDHSDSERENPLPPHGLLFPISSVEHWLERETAQWVHHEGSIRRPIAIWQWPLIINSLREHCLLDENDDSQVPLVGWLYLF